HRDLKPANVVLRGDGAPVVIDLGLALAPERDQRLTQTGALIGTPRYMSPDQLRGSAEPTVDVYALGLILFELLTGEVATGDAETPAELIGNILSEPRPAPSSVDDSLPASLDELCARLLHQDPAQRPQHAGEVEALLAGLVGVPSLPRRRHSRRLLIGLTLAAAAALGLGLATQVGAEGPANSTPGAARAGAPRDLPAAPDPAAIAAAGKALQKHLRLQDLRERAEALAKWLAANPEHPEREEAHAAWVAAQRTFPLRTWLQGRDVQEIHPLPNKRLLVCSEQDVLVLDREGEELWRRSGTSWAYARLSLDRRTALLSYKSKTLRRVDLSTGEELGELETGLRRLEAFALSPDGKTLAVGGQLDDSLRQVGTIPASGGALRVLGRVDGRVRQLCFLKGRLLAGTGRNSDEAFGGQGNNRAFDNHTRIYDLERGVELVALRAMAAVDSLHPLPDGSFMAGTNIGELIRYDHEGKVLQTFVSRTEDGKPEFGNGILALALPGAVRGLTHIGERVYAAEGEINKGLGGLSEWTLTGQRLRIHPRPTAYRDAATDGEHLYLGSQSGLEVWLP
ncbi:MAG TPA: hypothetical protein DEA08_04955, partial [Planctomycetes bacterium]|nr:hypothetical protein [Planctomycetota bacterium]